MNRTFVLATALATGLAASSLLAQTTTHAPATARPAAPTAQAEVKPEAIPAKVAVIAFEQGVVATNEGQRAVLDIQKKYEPKKTAIDAQSAEVDSLKKQYQALPATLSDEERAARLKAIDDKTKALQRDVEDAQNSYNTDVQEAYGKVAQKFGGRQSNTPRTTASPCSSISAPNSSFPRFSGGSRRPTSPRPSSTPITWHPASPHLHRRLRSS